MPLSRGESGSSSLVPKRLTARLPANHKAGVFIAKEMEVDHAWGHMMSFVLPFSTDLSFLVQKWSDLWSIGSDKIDISPKIADKP